jgi:hypothetical protein
MDERRLMRIDGEESCLAAWLAIAAGPPSTVEQSSTPSTV